MSRPVSMFSLVTSLFLLVGCSDPAPATPVADAGEADTAKPDVAQPDTAIDGAKPDGGAPDVEKPDTFAPDLGAETTPAPFTDFHDVKDTFAGKDYTAWSVEWWKWSIAIPEATNPIKDGDCKQGQSGDVWFLAGTFKDAATRTCEIPEGKTLFFPLTNSICFPCHEDEGCSTPKTEAELTACTEVADAKSLHVEVDGKKIVADLKKHHFMSKQFSFKGPASGGIFGQCTGPIAANTCSVPVGDRYGVSDGYWVAIKPLPKGTHTLKFGGVVPSGGSDPDFKQELTYTITIK